MMRVTNDTTVPNKFKQIFSNRPAFLSYLTVGDGGLEYSKQAALAMVAGGVDILELGVPFSDPIADGPVIQAAMMRALAHDTTILDVFQLAQEIKAISSVPIVLFSYFNPLYALQQKSLLNARLLHAIDGILVVDLPIEESFEFNQLCNAHAVAPIHIITPSTPQQRIQHIDQNAHAFLYYACRRGITGMRDHLPADFSNNIQSIKRIAGNPVVAGFGISTRQHAAEAIQHTDGFVVGSRFVHAMAQQATPAELTTLAQSLDPRGVS